MPYPNGLGGVVKAPQPDGIARKTTAAGLSARILVAALIAFYVLLPLDIGFPTVPLLGRPLNSAIAATLVVFFIMTIQSRGKILSFLREPYSLVQLACVYVLVGSALRSASPPSALHASLLYCSTFVLNYLILRYVTRRHGVRWLSPVVVTIGVAAAAVAISAALIGLPVPMYDAWYQQVLFRGSGGLLTCSRASGRNDE